MLSTSVSNRFSTHLISAAPSPIAAFLFLPLEFLTTKSFFSWLFLSFFPPFPLLFSFFYSFISSECTPTSLRSNTYFSAIQIVSDRLHPPPLNPHIYPQFSFFFFLWQSGLSPILVLDFSVLGVSVLLFSIILLIFPVFLYISPLLLSFRSLTAVDSSLGFRPPHSTYWPLHLDPSSPPSSIY